MLVTIIPSVAYLRMHVELAKSSLEDLAEESQKPQCLAHLKELLEYLSAINRTDDIEAVYVRVEGGKDRIRAKRPGEHFEVHD
jgi:hypothetical protein